jgi:hypothetical protein
MHSVRVYAGREVAYTCIKRKGGDEVHTERVGGGSHGHRTSDAFF